MTYRLTQHCAIITVGRFQLKDLSRLLRLSALLYRYPFLAKLCMRFLPFTSEVRNAAGTCLHAVRAVQYWQFEGASLNRCSRKTSGAATMKKLVRENGTGPKKKSSSRPLVRAPSRNDTIFFAAMLIRRIG